MGTENLRKFFEDDRIHVVAAKIVLFAGETKHYKINEEKNIIVSVETHNHGMEMWANLTNTPGVWTIPDIGTEVMIGSDNGDIEGEAYVIGLYPSTNVLNAESPQSLAPQVFNVVVTGNANITVGPGSAIHLLSDTKVEMASVIGSGKTLSVQDELHALWQYVMNQFDAVHGHTHTVVGGATTAIVESGSAASLPTVAEPVGTQIARGE